MYVIQPNSRPARRARQGRRKTSRGARTGVERLEDRLVLSSTTVTQQVALVSPVITVESTDGFPTTGDIAVQTNNGSVAVINYTGINAAAHQFTGCDIVTNSAKGGDALLAGAVVKSYDLPITKVAAASDGQTVINDAGTIVLQSLSGFAKSGDVAIQTTSGVATVSYTSIDTATNTLKGCTLVPGGGTATWKLATDAQAYATIPFRVHRQTGLAADVPVYYVLAWNTVHTQTSYVFKSGDNGASGLYVSTAGIDPGRDALKDFSYKLNFSASGEAIIDVPAIPTNSARMIFGINTPPSVGINADRHSIAAPNLGDPGDPNVQNSRIVDFIEYAYNPVFAANSFAIDHQGLNMDTSLVDQFGFPISLQATPPDANVNGGDGVGVQIDRANVVDAFKSYITNTVSSAYQDAFLRGVVGGGTIDGTSYPVRIVAPYNQLSLDYNAGTFDPLQSYFNSAIAALFGGKTASNPLKVVPGFDPQNPDLSKIYTATTITNYSPAIPDQTVTGTIDAADLTTLKVSADPSRNVIGLVVTGPGIAPGTTVVGIAVGSPRSLILSQKAEAGANLSFKLSSPYVYTVLEFRDSSGALVGDVYEPFFSTNTAVDVASTSLTNNVVTVNTKQPHGFFTGQMVTLKGTKQADGLLNGTYKITSVPSTTSFTFTLVHAGDLAEATEPAALAYFGSDNVVQVSNVSLTGNVATVTTSAAHSLFVGEVVTLQGLSNQEFNGTFTVTKIDAASKTFSFALVHEDVAATTDSGTVAVGSSPPLPWIAQDANAPANPVVNKSRSPGEMVFANNGVFADNGPNPDPKGDLGNIENQIVSALSRGVANIAPGTKTSSEVWADPANFYNQGLSKGSPANFYAGFWHLGSYQGVPISKGNLAYGFPFDDQGGKSTDFTSIDPTNIDIVLGDWLPVPTLQKVDPASAKVGATVTITGFNLASGGTTPKVEFVPVAGGTATTATVTSFTPNKLVITVPAGLTANSQYHIVVTTPDGTSRTTNKDLFTVLADSQLGGFALMKSVADNSTALEVDEVRVALRDVKSPSKLAADVLKLNADTSSEGEAIYAIASGIESSSTSTRKQVVAALNAQIETSKMLQRVATLTRDMLQHLKSPRRLKQDLRLLREALVRFDRHLDQLAARFLVTAAVRKK
ncbi:beta-1,3-glucanase family protein [Aquisphaera insulae]|uniref:beta-1,3-glucanase family protein n=1 Tax=Aquisphaera insulae TaxID=2712864 RepID=UPI0013EB7164|nr:beta-1,3-glucanase family protein [Aquisphaera insulae]